MSKVGNILMAARLGMAKAFLPGGWGIGLPTNNGPYGAPMAYYQAGKETRRDIGWRPGGLGPNAMADGFGGSGGFGGLESIRNRARDLADNNELVDAAASTAVDAVVRTGLDDFEPDTGFDDLDTDLRAVYELAISRVDAERSMTLAESQEIAQRELEIVGEIGVFRGMAPAFKGFPAMPAIELIEAERIPLDLSGKIPNSENVIRQGIEFEKAEFGKGHVTRIVAYHVLRAHPRDGGMEAMFDTSVLSRDVVRIPAEHMDLMINLRRVKQLRGVPPTVSVMQRLRTVDGFIESTMDLATLISSMGLAMESTNADLFKRRNGVEPLAVDASGNPITTVRGLQLMFLKPGTKEPKAIAPNVPGPQFGEVMRWMMRLISKGLRRRYDETSNDYSQTTFASGQMGAIDQDRADKRKQQKLLEHHTRPFLRDVANWGVLSGRVTITPTHMAGTDKTPGLRKHPERLYRTWVGLPGRGAINPKQDADATAMNLASGVTSEIEQISAAGGNWKRTVQERLKLEKYEAEQRAEMGLPPRPVGELRAKPSPAPDQNRDDESEEDRETRLRASAEDGGINDLRSDRARRNGAVQHA